MDTGYARFVISVLCVWFAFSFMAVGQGGSEMRHVFYVDSNRHVDQWYQHPNSNFLVDAWQDVTAASGGRLADLAGDLTGYFAPSGEHVFHVDSTQHIQHLLGNATQVLGRDRT